MKSKKYKPIPISAGKEIANKYDKDQVIIMTWDKDHGRMHVTTYGKTKADCAMAAQGGNLLKKTLGFPDYLCSDVPARVKKKQSMHPIDPGPPAPKSLLDWGPDGLYDDTRAVHLHGLCHSSSDGDCSWRECPQLKNYRSHCPLDVSKECPTCGNTGHGPHYGTGCYNVPA